MIAQAIREKNRRSVVKRSLGETQHEGQLERTLPREQAVPQKFGNQAMQHALRSRTILAKLALSQPGDTYENEADRIANSVMGMETDPAKAKPAHTNLASPAVQRCPGGCPSGGCHHDKEEMIRLKRATTSPSHLDGATEAQITGTREGGQRLIAATRRMFESRFGHDFSGVRVHTDTHAAESARAINALAYTYGQDIMFGAGQYAPHTQAGQRLIAHELTHVVQQNSRAAVPTVQRFTPAQCTASTCTPAVRCGTVQGDFDRAEGYLNDAIAAMSASPLSARTARALRWYFRRGADTPDGAILRRLRFILQVLNTEEANGNFACRAQVGSCASTTLAFVNPPAHLAPDTVVSNTIKLCSDNYFGEGPGTRAMILIHEASHLIGMSVSTDDVYRHTIRFRSLPEAEALLNADSYALFAWGLSQGIPVSVPISFGAAGGVVGGSPTGEAGWFASFHIEPTFQHPVLHLFNPTARLSLTVMGVPESGEPPPPGRISTAGDLSLMVGLLPGFRIEDPRPSGGTGYFALRGGPTFNLRGTDFRVGAEVGVDVGYRWRWLDVGVGATYNYDPTAREGARDLVRIGPTITFTPGTITSF